MRSSACVAGAAHGWRLSAGSWGSWASCWRVPAQSPWSCTEFSPGVGGHRRSAESSLQSTSMFEIGNSLREARLRQSLELSDVERATKIPPKYLRALEDEQFELLPAQTYVKGFLNTYAEFLGLDGQLYVDEYNSRYVTREEEEPFRPRRSTGHAQPSPRVERRPRHARRHRGRLRARHRGVEVGRRHAETPPRSPTPDCARRPKTCSSSGERAARAAWRCGGTRRKVRSCSPERSGTGEKCRSASGRSSGCTFNVRRPSTWSSTAVRRPPGRLLFVDASGVERAPAAN